MSKRQEAHHQKKARLRIILPTGETCKRKVTGAESRIGSGLRSEILIPDPEVSTAHAALALIGGSYFILDEGSEAGTFVNGEKVEKLRKLSDGDVIKVGNSQITFRLKRGDNAHKGRLAGVASSVAAAEANPTSGNGRDEGGKKKKHKHDKHKHDKHKAETDARDNSAVGATAPSNNGEVSKQGKKEKKGKESADDRIKAAKVRAWGGIIATILSVVLTVTISIAVTRMGAQQNAPLAYGSDGRLKSLAGLSGSSKFSGGKYEASGAVAVPDANAILFVDDSKPDRVFYMPVNELGEQDGPIKEVPLGLSVENPEGITQFGSRFMIVGALSTHESDNAGGVAVF